MTDYKRYIIVFIITLLLFITGFYLSNYFNSKKVASLQSIQDEIALNILSSETQFDLLSDSTCSDPSNSILTEQLSSLSEKLDYGERTIGANDPEMVSLRNYFSLLEIKDILLLKRVNERCHTTTPYMVYFYSNEEDCEDCARQWRAISALRDQYPEVRVYVFDYHTELSAAKTLVTIYKLDGKLPAIVIDGKTYTEFKDLPELKELLKVEDEPVEETDSAATKTTPAVTTPKR